jgi:hypothetical protein
MTEENAEYIVAMTQELAELAEEDGMDTLAYILRMAEAEARTMADLPPLDGSTFIRKAE